MIAFLGEERMLADSKKRVTISRAKEFAVAWVLVALIHLVMNVTTGKFRYSLPGIVEIPLYATFFVLLFSLGLYIIRKIKLFLSNSRRVIGDQSKHDRIRNDRLT
jgi:thiosulfate reductase cytochrome b subunit